jgi:hypothetical protein
MDLVSFETADEYQYFKNIMQSTNVQFIWTSGRLCDFDGCDRPEFFPKNINGWFWSVELLYHCNYVFVHISGLKIVSFLQVTCVNQI